MALPKVVRDAERLDIVDLMRPDLLHNQTARLADTVHATAAVVRSSATPEKILHQIWPAAVIGTGLVLTGAWTCLLAYGLVLVSGFGM